MKPYCDGCKWLVFESRPGGTASNCENPAKAPWLGRHRTVDCGRYSDKPFQIIQPKWCPGKEGRK